MEWTGFLDFYDPEEIYSGVSFQVSTSFSYDFSLNLDYVLSSPKITGLSSPGACSHGRWITSHVHTPIFPQPKHSHCQRLCLGSKCCVSGERTGLLAAIRRRMGIPISLGPSYRDQLRCWQGKFGVSTFALIMYVESTHLNTCS